MEAAARYPKPNPAKPGITYVWAGAITGLVGIAVAALGLYLVAIPLVLSSFVCGIIALVYGRILSGILWMVLPAIALALTYGIHDAYGEREESKQKMQRVFDTINDKLDEASP